MLRDIGESEYFDERSVYLIAAGIERNAEARMLTLANVINFFYDARIGKINFFCSRLNVRHFMRAFAQYATEQREIEKRIHLLSEQQRQREIQTQHDAGTHTWEQYCAARGIDTSLSVEAYLMQQIESK
jgi:hypothetical protein